MLLIIFSQKKQRENISTKKQLAQHMYFSKKKSVKTHTQKKSLRSQ